MKKNLQFLSVLTGIMISGSVAAQSGARVISPVGAVPTLSSSLPAQRSAACGPDALDYVSSKVSAVGADSMFYFELWPAEMTSTAYTLDGTATISDVFVFGKLKTGDVGPVSTQVSIWNVDASGQPTTMIAGSTATLDIAAATAPAYHLFTFATPVTVTDDFAVVLTNIDSGSDDFWAIGSDGDPANPALLEGLSYYDWQGFWEPMSDVYGGIGEGVLIPVVSYSVTSDFTPSAMTICAGDAVTFTNTSSALYANRVFNLNAFDTYFLSETDSTFEWNFGDGSPAVMGTNQTHTYTTAGTYTVTLTGEMAGYLDSCVDVKSTVITVMATPAAAFTYDDSMSPSVTFTDGSTASGTITYAWDFGDGNSSSIQNPTHTYAAPGTYNVTLTVTDMCGTVTSSQTVTLSSVGISSNAGVNVNASVVSAENLLYITLPASSNATVEVYNIVGKLICSESGVNTATKTISLDGVAAGTYVVRVKTVNGLGAAKFSVLK